MNSGLDYAPRRVLAYMRDGYLLRDNNVRCELVSPEANSTVDVNARTFRVLLERGLVEPDTTWNHPIVTRFRLTAAGRALVTPADAALTAAGPTASGSG